MHRSRRAVGATALIAAAVSGFVRPATPSPGRPNGPPGVPVPLPDDLAEIDRGAGPSLWSEAVLGLDDGHVARLSALRSTNAGGGEVGWEATDAGWRETHGIRLPDHVEAVLQ